MLQRHVGKHEAAIERLNRVAERETASAASAAREAASGLVDAVDADISKCFELERLINGEIRELRAAAERAQASTSAWAAALAPLDDALRSLGDSESFFGAAAREVEGIAAALSREAAAAEAAAAAAAAETAAEKEATLEALAAAVVAAVEGEAFRPPTLRSTSSRRALRLASTRRALVFDALAVASGVRSGAMLDYCPGLDPGAAASLAAAASGGLRAEGVASDGDAPAAPGAAMVAAHLDGCCYLLNSRLLGGAPPLPPPATPGAKNSSVASASAAAGAFSGAAPWPLVFRGEPLAPRWGRSEVEGRELAASLAPLAAAVRVAAVEAAALSSSSASFPSSSSSSSSPPSPVVAVGVVDLDKMTSLPAAPALNAFMLGYPVAYSVGDREEAALASRALRSGSGGGGGRGGEGGGGGYGASTATTTLALVTLTARALPCCCPSSSSSPPNNPSDRAKVCSFSVPLDLWEQAKRPREGDDEEEREGEGTEGDGCGDGNGGGSGGGFVSAWAESVRASAIGAKGRVTKVTGSPLSCLFRGEGLRASVEFVDSGGVTM